MAKDIYDANSASKDYTTATSVKSKSELIIINDKIKQHNNQLQEMMGRTNQIANDIFGSEPQAVEKDDRCEPLAGVLGNITEQLEFQQGLLDYLSQQIIRLQRL